MSSKYVKVTLNKVPRSLVAGLDLRAAVLNTSREKMLIELLQKEFQREEAKMVEAMDGEDTPTPSDTSVFRLKPSQE